MAGYVRQSAASIITGETVTAAPLNAEFNKLVAAFHNTTGHTHDGSTGGGPKIPITSLADLANLRVYGNVSGVTGPVGAVVILDEDNMATDSATALATQQSTKAYTDTRLALAGGTMSGAIAMGTNRITGAGDPVDDQDVVTKAFLVSQTAAAVAATAADVVLTNADVVSTAADVVSTGNDVISTNADVVLTNADVTYTQQWAIRAEDSLITAAAGGDESTDYSALHWAAKAAASAASFSNEFADNVFQIKGSVDATKILMFEVDGFTTGTTRTVTVPDKSGTLAMTSDIPAASNTRLQFHFATGF